MFRVAFAVALAASLTGVACAQSAKSDASPMAKPRPKLSSRLGRAVEVYPSAQQVEGRCFLVSDPAEEQIGRVLVVGAESGTIERSIAVGQYGEWIRVVGDVDGDRLPDLVVGCGSDALCVSFRTGLVHHIVPSTRPVATLGSDLDDDGIEDLVAIDLCEVRIVSGRDGSTVRALNVCAHGVALSCAVDRRGPTAADARILVGSSDSYARGGQLGVLLVLSARLELLEEVRDPILGSALRAPLRSRFASAVCVVPGANANEPSTWFLGSPNDYEPGRPFEGEERDRVHRVDPLSHRAVPVHSSDSRSFGTMLVMAPDIDLDGRLDLLVSEPEFSADAGRALLISSAGGLVLDVFGPYENPQPKVGYDESELRTSSSIACSLGDATHRSIVVLGCRPLTNETRAIVRAVDVRTNELVWTLAAD